MYLRLKFPNDVSVLPTMQNQEIHFTYLVNKRYLKSPRVRR